MNLGDIMVKSVTKDFDPKASLSELEIFHAACGGGEVKTKPVVGYGGIKWEAECLRCRTSDTLYSMDVAKIFKVATEGKPEKYGIGITPHKISPK